MGNNFVCTIYYNRIIVAKLYSRNMVFSNIYLQMSCINDKYNNSNNIIITMLISIISGLKDLNLFNNIQLLFSNMTLSFKVLQ
jgi:hypothetical protein